MDLTSKHERWAQKRISQQDVQIARRTAYQTIFNDRVQRLALISFSRVLFIENCNWIIRNCMERLAPVVWCHEEDWMSLRVIHSLAVSCARQLNDPVKSIEDKSSGCFWSDFDGWVVAALEFISLHSTDIYSVPFQFKKWTEYSKCRKNYLFLTGQLSNASLQIDRSPILSGSNQKKKVIWRKLRRSLEKRYASKARNWCQNNPGANR